MIGTTLSHYKILGPLGAGGMGVVYRARDLRLERDVAIKVLPAGSLADEATRKQFRREALTLSRLNHPNIETIHDFDTDQDIDFLVLEMVSGKTLSERIAEGPLPRERWLWGCDCGRFEWLEVPARGPARRSYGEERQDRDVAPHVRRPGSARLRGPISGTEFRRLSVSVHLADLRALDVYTHTAVTHVFPSTRVS